MKHLLMTTALVRMAVFNNSPDDVVIPDADGVVVIDTPAGPTRINHTDFKKGEHTIFKGNDEFDHRGIRRAEHSAPASHVTPVPPVIPPNTPAVPPSQMGVAPAPQPEPAASISTAPPQGADDADDNASDEITDAQAERIKAINFGVMPTGTPKRFYVIDQNAANAVVVDMPTLIDVGGYKTNKAAWEAIQGLKARVGVA